jgi:acetyl-CoA carboxylase carboxyltransferase component
LPPEYPITDPIDRIEADLASIVPADRRKPYDMRRVVRGIFDLDSLFEIQPSFGRGVLTILARLGGKSVGVVANNPKVYGGAMDARAARKQARFIELCDTFHIPIIFLVDLPGFLVGPGAEEAGTLRDGMRAVYVAMQATVPMVTLVIRKCYGMAGMGACDKNGLNFKIGWPTAEIGNLPVEGGVMAAFRREIEAAPDPRQRENEIEQELRQLTSPYRMAEAFAIEEIIDPLETRPYLYDVLEAARVGMPAKLGRKPRYGVRP